MLPSSSDIKATTKVTIRLLHSPPPPAALSTLPYGSVQGIQRDENP